MLQPCACTNPRVSNSHIIQLTRARPGGSQNLNGITPGSAQAAHVLIHPDRAVTQQLAFAPLRPDMVASEMAAAELLTDYQGRFWRARAEKAADGPPAASALLAAARLAARDGGGSARGDVARSKQAARAASLGVLVNLYHTGMGVSAGITHTLATERSGYSLKSSTRGRGDQHRPTTTPPSHPASGVGTSVADARRWPVTLCRSRAVVPGSG